MQLLRRLNTRFVLHWPVMALVFGLAYFAAITLGQATSLRPSTIATFWPAAGVYVAALLLAAPRRWPALIAAAACTNLACDVLMLGKPFAMVLGFAAANALEALTGAVLIRLLTRPQRAAIAPGARLRDTLAVAAGAAASPVMGATLGAAAVTLATGAPFAATWPVWWAADALGILVAAPLVLAAAHHISARDHAAPIRYGEATLSFGVVLAAALTIFWLPTHAATPALPPFLMLPPLVWTALRLAPLPAMAAAALVAVVATAGTAAGFGVYAALGLSHAQLSVLLQMFLCIMVGTSQVLTAVITERRAALQHVTQANTGLEAAVTARTQALSDSEARLRVALLAAELGVWRWDVARGIDKLEWDARCRTLHFLPADASVTLAAWLEAIVPEDRQIAQAGIDPALAPDNPNDDYACEYRVRRPDGTVRWLAVTGRAFFRTDPASPAGRRAIHVLGVTRDITHAREAEQERRRHEARQSYLLALNRSLHDLSDPRAMMQAASALLGQHLGAAQVGFAKIDDAQLHARVRQAWNDGRVASVAGTWRVHDIGAGLTEALRAGQTVAIPDITGEPRASDALETYCRIGVRALLGVPLIRDDRLVALLFVHHPEPRTWTADDIALAEETCQRLGASVERARAEAALRRSEAFATSIVHATSDCLAVLDAEGRIVFMNEPGRCQREIDDLSDVIGRRVDTLWPDGSAALVRAALAQALAGQTASCTAFGPTAKGTPKWWDITISPMPGLDGEPPRLLSVARDVTQTRDMQAVLERLVEQRTQELQDAQTRLAHVQRMEALGKLAGGIAHDFNNVLQAIQGGISLIERRPTDLESVRRLTRMVMHAAERGAAITHRLLAFSRRGDLRAEPVNPTVLLTEIREILSHTLGTGIEVRLALPPALPTFSADKGQLETVLINLATNARDAMSGSGLLTLAAGVERVRSADPRRNPPGLDNGAYLCISVTDTGAGMPPEVLGRATEPFFTTKSRGKGTGLGLAMARGFAEQSGGGLQLDSVPGRGTTVRLWFPLAAGRPAAPPSDAAARQAAPKYVRLMLVDDDPIVRQLLIEQLRIEGFDIVSADRGAAALALLDAGERVDLIVSDLSMPGMDGLDTIRGAQQRRPGLPAILLTGFATEAAELADGTFSLLRKPVTARQLADHATALLDATAPATI